MLKLLLVAALLAFACRAVFAKWPWEYLRAKPTRAQAVVEARKLLAVPHDASREDIVAAHRRLVATVHPDRGGTSAKVHEVNAARDLLLARLPKPN